MVIPKTMLFGKGRESVGGGPGRQQNMAKIFFHRTVICVTLPVVRGGGQTSPMEVRGLEMLIADVANPVSAFIPERSHPLVFYIGKRTGSRIRAGDPPCSE